MDGSSLTIKYFDFSSCFPIFARRLEFLPALVEVRVGADVPPEYRNVSRKHKNEVRTPTREMCELLQGLQVLSQLSNLVLKDISNTELEAALSCCGWRLERLEVHYVTTGVDLSLIDKLNICQFMLYFTYHIFQVTDLSKVGLVSRVCFFQIFLKH